MSVFVSVSGQNRWRVPTQSELLSLLWGELPASSSLGFINPNREVQAAYKRAFPADYGIYWSITPSPVHDSYALCVDFGSGSTYIRPKRFKNTLRLVRETGKSGTWVEGDEPGARYVVVDGATVLDAKTGLEWKSDALKVPADWRHVVLLDMAYVFAQYLGQITYDQFQDAVLAMSRVVEHGLMNVKVDEPMWPEFDDMVTNNAEHFKSTSDVKGLHSDLVNYVQKVLSLCS